MSKFRTPLKNVRGLGSAKTGTEHFVHQCLTAAALVVLAPRFPGFGVRMAGADHATAAAPIAKPWNAVPLFGPPTTMFSPSPSGLLRPSAASIHVTLLSQSGRAAVKFVAVLGMIVSVFAVGRIALGVA